MIFARMAVQSLSDLRTHLQWAIELEHSTMPPYLCALYSLHAGRNQEAADVITSVFVEEMLHMTLAANLLNAVGGTPVLDRPDFSPTYPSCLPHSARAFEVSLAPFSPEAVETFMRIERPEAPDAPPEDDGYHTIGQFYHALEDGLRRLCDELGERALFCGDPARQITPSVFDYTGSGRIIAITNLQTALEAIDEIEEQGEGLKHAEVWDGDRDMFHPEREEVAHYFRFVELQQGRWFQKGDTPASGPTGRPFAVDWTAVHPMRRNPRVSHFELGTPIRTAMDGFNLTYWNLLRDLQRAFTGAPHVLPATLGGMMRLARQARALIQMPVGDGTHAGPSFEYVPAHD